ncbi:MAG: hypothetical protein HY716_04260 [Planctomycetes bacterium]|nr:hypothetical protein [Planctomycetota bacterium]
MMASETVRVHVELDRLSAGSMIRNVPPTAAVNIVKGRVTPAGATLEVEITSTSRNLQVFMTRCREQGCRCRIVRN